MYRFISVLIAAGSAVIAQSLSGLITDAAHLPVSGAHVEVRYSVTGVATRALTDPAGTFHFPAMQPGAVEVNVLKDGFRPYRRSTLQLKTGDRLQFEIVLEVGPVSEAVEVRADAPLLQSARGTTAFTVGQEKVATLPLDGRNFVPLIALAPGVSLPAGSVLPRINGSRPRVSEYVYDGISVLQPEPGQVALYPIIDAIAEFRVETNSPSAEYGRSNGGIILVQQRSGSNELHGTAFEFFRNEALNARNLFATQGPKPLFRRNQYGFVVGGPVQRNRTFFFADWQRSDLKTGIVRTSTVPDAAMRDGRFGVPVTDGVQPFPDNTIPRSRFDAVAAAEIERYPLPNRRGQANNFVRTGTETTRQNQADVRMDRHFNAAHRVFARYSWVRDNSTPTAPLPDGSGLIRSGILGDTLTTGGSLATEHSWTVNSSTVNQFRIGHTHRGFAREALSRSPIYDLVGFQQLGASSGANGRLRTSVTQFLNTLSHIRGAHSMKAGFDIRRQRLDVFQPASPNGTYQFSPASTGHSVASFLLGKVQSFSIDVQEEILQPRATVAEFFVQEDWRASRKLTLNAGVRYTLNFPSIEARDRAAVFNLETQQLDYLGRNGVPRSARDLEKLNLGPRVGLAYRLSDSLVWRSGYSLTWIEQAGITTPFTTPMYPFIRMLEQRSPDGRQPAFLLAGGPTAAASNGGVFGVQRNGRSGYAQQWNGMLQKTFGANWSVEAGYLGSKLTNLGVPDVNLNQVRLEDLAGGRVVHPYPNFGTVALYRNNVGHSTYHSLQSRVEKRLADGLTFSASYTFSRLIDDAGAVFDSAVLSGPVTNFQVADSYNRRLEKDVSTGNMPHVFSAGLVYDWKRWQFAGIARVQSGSPVAVTQATNWNACAGFGIQRPNRLRDPRIDDPTPSRYFDTTAFAPAPQFTIGNSSRNPVAGPGYRTLDLMVGRRFAVTERASLELRAEAFNVTNTPPLGAPNGSFGTTAFGTITSALDPRVFELVCKIHF